MFTPLTGGHEFSGKKQMESYPVNYPCGKTEWTEKAQSFRKQEMSAIIGGKTVNTAGWNLADRVEVI